MFTEVAVAQVRGNQSSEVAVEANFLLEFLGGVLAKVCVLIHLIGAVDLVYLAIVAEFLGPLELAPELACPWAGLVFE